MANSLSALIPEFWAQEALMILEERLVAAGLVNRNYEATLQEYGDTVNVHKPASFVATRKDDGVAVTTQDATVDTVAVKLDQWNQVSFLIRDREASLSFKELIPMFVERAARALAKRLDELVVTQAYKFMHNRVGHFGTALTESTLISLREKMNTLMWPEDQRYFLCTPGMEADLLKVDKFSKVNESGTSEALRMGAIGQLYGINSFMSQMMPVLTFCGDTVTDTVNLTAGYGVGDTTIILDDTTGFVAGMWCTLAGDATPQLITAVDASDVTITISPGLTAAVADGATVTGYVAETVNESPSGYSAAYARAITMDTTGTAFSPRGCVSVWSSGATCETVQKYGLVGTPTTTSWLFETALQAALADGASLFPVPPGEYGFAFNPNAITLVTRSLATPMAGTGVQTAIATSPNGLALRAQISYDSEYQQHRITLDMLNGVKVLDNDLGITVFG